MYREIQKGVITWRDILRITGGELELDKTWIGLLIFDYDTFKSANMNKHAVYRAGMPKLVNSQELPTKITIKESIVNVDFKELAPDQGHELLGIRLALSGSFADEYSFRKKQVSDFAKKLKATAFDIRDAWMIYQARYKPKIRYCLPITTFTFEECCEIQRPFICAFINKLGMNRNTKRAVIWGPLMYGGLEIMHLPVQQIAEHCHLMISNIRKENATGTCILKAMGAYQLILGCGESFWKCEDLTWYPTYKATHSSLQYVWEGVKKLRGHLHVPGMWTPKKQFEGDTAIMDDFARVAKDRLNNPITRIKMNQIYMANACRLYLKVTWMSELLSWDGACIAGWAYNGTQQNGSATKYAYQPKPPAEAWVEWKRLVVAAYFGGPRTPQMDANDYPLYMNPIQYNAPITDKPLWPPPSTDLSLEEIIDYMPPVWKQILGYHDIPTDDGAQIAQVLASGNTVRCWSDGSADDGVGSHAYTLQPACRGDDHAFMGDNGTPGHPESMASNRTESFGAAAICLAALAIEHKYQIPKGGYLVLHIDI